MDGRSAARARTLYRQARRTPSGSRSTSAGRPPACPGATGRFHASLDAIATLERHLHVLAPAIADHAAALIDPPVPTAPTGSSNPRGVVLPGVVGHDRTCPVPCIPSAIEAP